jgi:hypothetical protein
VVNYRSQVFSNGNWKWADLGLPPGANCIDNPSAVTYQGADGIQYIAVFAESDAGDLVVEHWDGGQWVWDDLSAVGWTLLGFYSRWPACERYHLCRSIWQSPD